MNKYFVTGAAGFIGYHISLRLLDRGEHVVGVDNLNDYYDVQLKRDRLQRLQEHSNFHFYHQDIADREQVARIFSEHSFSQVIHMAAQAGVRYSLENPHAYVDSNLVGFVNLLEGCRHQQVEHFVYASSSSVYGANTEIPFSTSHAVDHPVSLYAATKRANELMAHTYSHLYQLPTTGLRFFTVYGPWGRPDMALFLFTQAILSGQPIKVFNHGEMRRDFTYVEDVAEGVLRTAKRIPVGESKDGPASSAAPFKVYNIGNHQPVELLRLIEIMEQCLGREAIKEMLPMQAGDVPETYADVEDLRRDTGFQPATPIEQGVRAFADWYREYYKV